MGRSGSSRPAFLAAMLAALLVRCGGGAGAGAVDGGVEPRPGFVDGGTDAGGKDDGEPGSHPIPDAGDGGKLDAGTLPGTGDGGSAPPPASSERGAELRREPFDGRLEDADADATGNAYLLAAYSGQPSFRGVQLPNDGTGRPQHALLKLDPLQRVRWVRALPSGGCLERCGEGALWLSYRIAVWADGHVALAIGFQGTLKTPVGTFVDTSAGQEEVGPESTVVARLTPDGRWLWARALRAKDFLEPVDIAAAGGFLAVSGTFAGASSDLATPGNRAAFGSGGYLVRFNIHGVQQASHVYWGSVTGVGRGVALASDGRVWVVGQLLDETPTGERRFAPYLAHLAAAGSLAWERREASVQLLPENLSLARDGSLIADARANSPGTFRWAGRELRLEGRVDRDVLVSFGPGGEERWATLIPGGPRCKSVTASSSDYVTVAMRVFEPVDLGGGPRGETGRNNLLVARYQASDGSHVWSEARALDAQVEPTVMCGHHVTLLPHDGEALVATSHDGLFHVIPRH